MAKEVAGRLVGILALVAVVASLAALVFLPIAVGWYLGVGVGLVVACVACVMLAVVCAWLIVRIKSRARTDDGS